MISPSTSQKALSRINNYAKSMHSQIKKTHGNLSDVDIFNIMGLQALNILAIQPEFSRGPVSAAIRMTAELLFTYLLTDEEFINYQKETEELRKNAALRQSGADEKETVQTQIISEQATDSSSIGQPDQHSNETKSLIIKYPY